MYQVVRNILKFLLCSVLSSFVLVFGFLFSYFFVLVDADFAGERRGGEGGSLLTIGLVSTKHGAYGVTVPRRRRGDGENRRFIDSGGPSIVCLLPDMVVPAASLGKDGTDRGGRVRREQCWLRL